MKISNREKILIAILGVFLVVYGYYNYVFLKQSAMVEAVRNNRNTLETKLASLNSMISNLDKRESNLKILNSKIQDSSILLYPTIAQEKIIIELDELMAQSKINGALSFTEVDVKVIQSNTVEQKQIAKGSLQPVTDEYNSKFNKDVKILENSNKTAVSTSKQMSKAEGSNVEQMQATLTFNGSYENIISFIKNIENHPKKIVITNMNISQSSKTEINGSCQLEFYAVPKISDEDAEYIKWSYNNPYGKVNPFDGGSSITMNNTIEQTSTAKKDAYDFVMSVRSISSDLPTIMLGKANDSAKNSYVYGDSNSKESVEIVFTQEGGEYYYKYKTSRGSFPMQYDGNGTKFKLVNGDISLKVFSNKRIGSDDKSAADIKITNKTDKVISVLIENDDSLNPRVSIAGEGSSVDVKRQ